MPRQPAPPVYVVPPTRVRQRVQPPPRFAVIGGANPPSLTDVRDSVQLVMASTGQQRLITPRPLFE